MTLSVRWQSRPDAFGLEADAPLVQLHERAVHVLENSIASAVGEVPGEDRGDWRAILDDTLDALDGRVASVAATARETGDYAELHDVLGRLGSGHVGGQPSGSGDVFGVLPPLFAAAETTPTLDVSLGLEFLRLRPEQRAAVLEWLVELAMGADVSLVVGEVVARRLEADHADVLPAHCLKSVRNRRSTPAPAREAVGEAVDTLNRDGRPAAVLRACADAPTDSITYAALRRRLGLEDTPSETLRRLEADLSLVERTRRADGERVVSLRPAGLEAHRALDRVAVSDGGRASRGAASSWSDPGSDAASDAPQISPDMPCSPEDGTAPPDPPGEDAAPGDARPTAEGAATADGDRRENYRHGAVFPEFSRRDDWVPGVEATEGGEVLLQNVDLSGLEDDRDGRRPLVSFDSHTETVHVAAEFHNPMQFAVALASGLVSEDLLSSADWAGRIGEDLRGLEVHERPVLWHATCLGWLPSDVEDGADVLQQWREARDDLRTDSGLTDTDACSRSEVARRALGLIGTVVQTLDLLDVDVVLEARVAQFSRHFGETGNSSRREDLQDHLGMLASLCSRVGAFSAFRQLHETREDRREDAFTPGFGSGNHGSEGSMNASLVVVGDGVEDMAAALEDLQPRPVHEEAPPVGVSVEVVAGCGRRRWRSVLERMLSSRGLEASRPALKVLRSFVASPWAACEGIQRGLGHEDPLREIYQDEIRRILKYIDEDRLLPTAAASARAGVAALLDADEPLQQSELCDRGEISTQSWRNHRDALEDAGVVLETAAGWRVTLPFRSERGAEDAVSPPWWLLEDAAAADVLWWLAEERDALGAATDPDTSLGAAFETVTRHGHVVQRAAVDRVTVLEAADALGVPPGLLLSATDSGPPTAPPTATARLGAETEQTTLPI